MFGGGFVKKLLVIIIIFITFTSAYAENGVSEYKLKIPVASYQCNIPVYNYDHKDLTKDEIVSAFVTKFILSSKFPYGTYKQYKSVTAYNGLFVDYKTKSDKLIFEYHGNTEIKEMTKNRVAKTTVEIPYHLSDGKFNYTLPENMQIESVRGFSLFDAKQLADPTEIEKDLIEISNKICANDEFSLIYQLNREIFLDEDKESIIKRANDRIKRQGISYLFCRELEKTDGVYRCEAAIVLPIMPDNLQSWDNISNKLIEVTKNRIISHLTIDFRQYMTGYKIKYEVPIPYVVDSASKSIVEPGITETQNFVEKLLSFY